MANLVLLCTKNPSFKVSYTTKNKNKNKRKATVFVLKDQGVKEDTHSLSSGRGACLVSWLVGCVVLFKLSSKNHPQSQPAC